MSSQFDRVNLPDPTSDSLLHPLDVEEARGSYLVATLLRLCVSPSVLTAMMLFLWVVSNNTVSPAVSSLITLTVAAYTERRFRTDAWAHIPRRRQDVGRDEPTILASLARFVELALLSAAVVAFVSSVGIREVPTTVSSVALGAMAGVAMAVVATLLWDRSAPRDHRFAPEPSIVTNIFGALVLLVLALGVFTLAGQITIELAEVLVGFAVIVGAMTVWLLLRLVPARIRCVPASLDVP